MSHLRDGHDEFCIKVILHTYTRRSVTIITPLLIIQDYSISRDFDAIEHNEIRP